MGIRSMSPYENSFTDCVRMVHLVIVASCSRHHTHTYTNPHTSSPVFIVTHEQKRARWEDTHDDTGDDEQHV